MKQQFIKIGAAALILMVFLLLGWWKDKKVQSDKNKEDQDAVVLETELDQLSRIKISSDGQNFVFERRKKNDKGKYDDEYAFLSDEFTLISDWLITKPIRALADHSAITTMKERVTKVLSEKVISESDEHAADYGLNPPKVELQFFGKEDKKAQVLKIGDKNPNDTHLYAQSSKSKKIHLVSNALKFFQTKKLQDWREMRVMGFPRFDTLQKMSIAKGKVDQFVFEKQGEHWMITLPQKLPANEDKVEDIARMADGLRAVRVATEDGDKELAKYGLDSSAIQLKVKIKDGDKEHEQVLLVGKLNQNKSAAFAKRPKLPIIYEIRKTFSDTLRPKLDDLVSLSAFYKQADSVKEIQIELGGTTHNFTQKEKEWYVKEDASEKPKKYLGAVQLITLDMDKYLGTKKPNFLGDVLLKAKADDESVMIYQTQTTRENKNYYLAHVEKYGLYYEITQEKVDQIRAHVEDAATKVVREEAKEEESKNPKVDHQQKGHEGHHHE